MSTSIPLPFRIFAVDPATGDSGWAVLDVISLHPLKIVIVRTGHIDADKLLKTQKNMLAIFNKQFCKLQCLEQIYTELITEWKPDYVASEGAFAHLHIAAMVSLVLAINTLRRVAYKLLNKDVTEIPPTISKRAWTGSGSADKDHMRLAYQSNKWIEGQVPDAEITEHEIDAVSHGAAFVRVHILGDVTQTSAKEKRRLKKEKKRLREEKLNAQKGG